MRIAGIIPARFNASRFPGKPLVMIGNMTMIERVYRQALAASHLSNVLVATDDERIFNTVKNFGGEVVMTSPSHKSGTDRCAEAALSFSHTVDAVINIQGDEPFIHPSQINDVAGCLINKQASIATLIRPARSEGETESRNTVKALIDKNGRAIYFSRLPIPFYHGDVPFGRRTYFIHTGIYGFRIHTLFEITQLPVSSLESAESLEQLRWIENGYTIHAVISDHPTYPVDVPEDLEAIKKRFNL